MMVIHLGLRQVCVRIFLSFICAKTSVKWVISWNVNLRTEPRLIPVQHYTVDTQTKVTAHVLRASIEMIDIFLLEGRVEELMLPTFHLGKFH